MRTTEQPRPPVSRARRAAERRITTSRATGCTPLRSPPTISTSPPSDQSSNRRVTHAGPSSLDGIDAVSLNDHSLSSSSDEQVVPLSHEALAFSFCSILFRSTALSLILLRSQVSSLPPPARAHHVLLSRSLLSGIRSLLPCATRAARTLRIEYRPVLLTVLLLPLPHGK